MLRLLLCKLRNAILKFGAPSAYHAAVRLLVQSIATLATSVILFSPSRTQAWNTPVSPVKYTSWTWTGAIDNDWNKGGNWCGSYLNGQCRGQTSPPGSSATVVFNDACTTNCSPTLSADASVYAMNLTGFSGSVNQGAFKLTIGVGGYFQNSGTFNAGAGDIEIGNSFTASRFVIANGTFNGSTGLITVGMALNSWAGNGNEFHILGGNFRAPSSILKLQSNSVQILSAVAFDHNNGTLRLDVPSNWSSLTVSQTLNNVILGVSNGKRIALNADLYVDGDLTVAGLTSTPGYLTSNKIHLRGNLIHADYSVYGTTAIRFMRSSGEQIVDNTGIQPNNIYLPAIEFDQPSTSASVRFIGEIGFGSSITATTTQGNFNTTAATFAFNNASVLFKPVYNAPLLPLTNTRFLSTPALDFTLVNLNVIGDLTIASAGSNSYSDTPGTVFLKGNLQTTGDLGSAGAAFNVRLEGTTAQTITSGSSFSWLPALTFANSGSGVTFAGNNPQFTGSLNYVSGNVTMPQPMRLRSSTNSYITLGSVSIQNLAFEFNCKDITLVQDLNVSGNVEFLNDSGTYNLDGANLNVSGNITATADGKGFRGNAAVRLVGTANQSIDTSAYSTGVSLPNFEIASNGGVVTFIGRTRYYGTVFKHTSGAVQMAGSSQYFLGSGNLTLTPGTLQFESVLLRTANYVGINGSRMVVTKDLRIGATASGRQLTGTGIDVGGELQFVNVGYSGSGTIRMVGATAAPLSAEATVVSTPRLFLEKSAAVSLASPVTLSQSLTVNSGSLDLAAAANALSVPSPLTLATGTSIKLSGASLTVGGTNVPAGPYSNGTIVP